MATKRKTSGTQVVPDQKLLKRISRHLTGMNIEDMTAPEIDIAQLLVKRGLLKKCTNQEHPEETTFRELEK